MTDKKKLLSKAINVGKEYNTLVHKVAKAYNDDLDTATSRIDNACHK